MGKEGYVPLNEDDVGRTSSELEENRHYLKTNNSPASKWMLAAILILVLTNGIQMGLLYRTPASPKAAHSPLEYAIPHEVPTEYRHFWWNTEYSGTNYTLQDSLWNSILPSHGFVAMDREWAKSQNWPESMYLPDDKSKGVYLLEAYHQLHCLKILRTTMGESLTGSEFTYAPGEHIEHCFDYMLQTTMCNADATPLYTFGDNTAGHGQLHKCRSWDALREFATENKACYRDTIEDVLLKEHFGYCDDGHDGLIHGNPVGRKVA